MGLRDSISDTEVVDANCADVACEIVRQVQSPDGEAPKFNGLITEYYRFIAPVLALKCR